MDGTSDPRVLLVEDESVVRFVTGEALRNEGFAVTEAENGEQALRLFRPPDHFDLVLTDIRMPGTIDGLDLASLVRHLDPQIPLLVVSAYAMNVEPRFRSLASPLLFIRKPYELRKLVDSVRTLIGQRPH